MSHYTLVYIQVHFSWMTFFILNGVRHAENDLRCFSLKLKLGAPCTKMQKAELWVDFEHYYARGSKLNAVGKWFFRFKNLIGIEEFFCFQVPRGGAAQTCIIMKFLKLLSWINYRNGYYYIFYTFNSFIFNFFKPHSLSRYKEAIIGPALWSLTPFLTAITGLTPIEKSLNEFLPKVGNG